MSPSKQANGSATPSDLIKAGLLYKHGVLLTVLFNLKNHCLFGYLGVAVQQALPQGDGSCKLSRAWPVSGMNMQL